MPTLLTIKIRNIFFYSYFVLVGTVSSITVKHLTTVDEFSIHSNWVIVIDIPRQFITILDYQQSAKLDQSRKNRLQQATIIDATIVIDMGHHGACIRW